MIPLSNPDITEAEIAAVVEVLRTSHLSLGPKLIEFESAIATYVGAKHAIGVSSGTAGLHLALLALDIHPGDEVILPSFTFIAAANSILYLRATPVFADIDPVTLNLDPAAVEKAITPRTRAIMVVHTFGHPADLQPLLDVANRNHLKVIEDACEAIGTEYLGSRIGALGDIGVFSFYPNKPITTGEGGVVVTNNQLFASHIKALRNQGRGNSDNWLEHSLLGYNYRLPEINCALGIEQLKRLDSIISLREFIAQRYSKMLRSTCPEVELPAQSPNGRISRFAFVVKLPRHIQRATVIKSLTGQGIGCRDYFPAIHTMPLYAGYIREGNNLAVTQDVAARTLALPFFNHLTDSQMWQVCQALRQALDACK